jgi:hypothetical protein
VPQQVSAETAPYASVEARAQGLRRASPKALPSAHAAPTGPQPVKTLPTP